MFKKLILSSLILLPSFLQSSQGVIVKLRDLWSRVLSFCDFPSIMSFSEVNKGSYGITQFAIDDLRKTISNNTFDPAKNTNFIALRLLNLDESIMLNNSSPSEEFLKNYFKNQFNPLDMTNQFRIRNMQCFIHLIIDRDCLERPLHERGLSSDLVAQRLGLTTYSLFYQHHLLNSLYPQSQSAFRDEDNPAEKFKCETYTKYTLVIDPYFKISYTFDKATDFVDYYRLYFKCDEKKIFFCSEDQNPKAKEYFLPFFNIIECIISNNSGWANEVTNKALDGISEDFDLLALSKAWRPMLFHATTIQKYVRTFFVQEKLQSEMAAAIIIQRFIRKANTELAKQALIEKFDNLQIQKLEQEKKQIEEEQKLKDNALEKNKEKQKHKELRRVFMSVGVLLVLGYLFYCGFLQSLFFQYREQS